MVVGFSVGISRPVASIAKREAVAIHSSTIIYRLMEDIKAQVIAMLPPIIEKRVTGEATVLKLFEISLKAKLTKKIAGCRVTNGLLEKSRKSRVVRNGEYIHEGASVRTSGGFSNANLIGYAIQVLWKLCGISRTT